MPNPNTKGISVHVDRELHAEITAYLQEHNLKMADFITMAAQGILSPPSQEIDPELQEEINAYLEEHDMTRDEFFALAARNELRPKIPGIDDRLQMKINAYLEEHDMTMDKFISGAMRDELYPITPETEVKSMGRTRTMAFQVDEEFFQRIKQYLKRHNKTQRQFVIDLIEDELTKDEELLRKEQEGSEPDEEEAQDETLSRGGEAPVSADCPDDEYEDEQEEAPKVGDSEESGSAEEENQDETPSKGGVAPVCADGPDGGYDDQRESPHVSDSEAEAEQEQISGGKEHTGELYEDFTDIEGGEFPEEGDEVEVPDMEDDEQEAADGLQAQVVADMESGPYFEVAPDPVFGEETGPAFPEPDEDDEPEYGGMGMMV